MNCTLCGRPVVLKPSAAERAAKDVTGKPAAYYTSLFTEHAECTLRQRQDDTERLIRSYTKRGAV
jgi:hypothetical protein